MSRTYIVAEAGACGDADLEKMEAQIEASAHAGADAVKFQWTSDAQGMARRRGRAKEDDYDLIYKRYLEWPSEWHQRLREFCQGVGIDYWCTVYLPQDVEVVAPYVGDFKVASFEAKDTELQSTILTACRSREKGQRMVISLGMCSDEEIGMLKWAYNAVPLVDFLHCVSAYPTPENAMHLRRIREHELDGFSDHTVPAATYTGGLAVAAGASLVEAHMKLETTDPLNPDATHAMNPLQLVDYVDHIRLVDQAMAPSAEDVESAMRSYRVTTRRRGG